MSQTFSIRELTYSDTAIRLGIDNTPTDEILINLQNVVQFILEPISNNFNSQIVITSGYRSPALCQAIGSSVTSQHTKGESVDFEILGIANKEVSDWIVNHLDFDQCILEFWKPDEPNSVWVHCSYKQSGNRKIYLRAFKGNGRVIYEVI